MIYFDNSATTKPYKEVLDSFNKVASDYFGNPSSLHGIGGRAEKLLSQARMQIAELLGAGQKEIFFTSGGTEGNNLAVKGTAMMHKSRGRHLITTASEHSSVAEAFEQLKELGFRVTYIPVDQDGRIRPEDIEAALCHDTILVSVIHVNNEVGTIQPIAEIGKMLKPYSKVLFHVDHVQGIAKVPLDFQKNEIDLCTISAHKFHGLKGTGVLYIREGVKLSPLFSGGSQEWNQRSGTENVPGIVSMAKALRVSLERYRIGLEQLNRVKCLLREGLESIEGISVHTPLEGSAPHILNFSAPGLKAEVFVHSLEEKNIYVSTTSACSSKKKSVSKTLLAMGIPEEDAASSIRISLSYDNTAEEAEAVLQAIEETAKKLRKVMK
ncbi:cysteine desulfurase family protein [Bacillus infantis]|uniref:cysteine desulfurase family protein n=1 Tax=Bacillus infantis TaxID=324767 RepID=UPI00209D7EB8|nr:cysteine desulfurase family protein [Bacillus infantis]MCP1160099.1 cysteine desulfurase [Bacillus infantis]